GWAYAVSAQHVKRLIAARADDKVLILQRRPPTLGLTMKPGSKEETVQVEHVEQGGPAEKAGIEAGDIVLEAEGLKVRTAYQVGGMVLNRQAGERVNLVVQHGADRKSLDVTLGSTSVRGTQATGGNQNYQAAEPANAPQQQQLYGGQKKMTIRARGDKTYD